MTRVVSNFGPHLMLRLAACRRSLSPAFKPHRTMSTSADYYVAVHQDGAPSTSSASAQGHAEIAQLWKASRASDKAGETRTFYGVAGDQTVVAVGLGKSTPASKKTDDAIKEQARRTVRLSFFLSFRQAQVPFG